MLTCSNGCPDLKYHICYHNKKPYFLNKFIEVIFFFNTKHSFLDLKIFKTCYVENIFVTSDIINNVILPKQQVFRQTQSYLL